MTGIMVKTGILVKIANPKKIPESKTRIFAVLLRLSLFVFLIFREYRAKSIEVKTKGSNRETSIKAKVLKNVNRHDITIKLESYQA